MKFAGYVQFRRGIIEHLYNGLMTGNEYIAFTILLALADKKTGGYKINASALATWSGGLLSTDAADRALRGLEVKHYVYRKTKLGSSKVYPYWINKYLLTAGPKAGRRLNLDDLFEKGDVEVDDILAFAEDIAGADAEPPAGGGAEPSAERPADKTILETGDRKQETREGEGGGSGGEASPASDSSEQEQEDQALIKLAHKFWSLLGEPAKYKSGSVLRRWTVLVSPKVKLHSIEYVLGVMTYALEDSEFWAPKFQNVKRCDPMQYLIEKFENIEAAREGDEKAAAIRNKKLPTFGSNGRATVASGSASAAGAPAYRKEKIEW
jgi:hypothetical protein